MTAAAREFRLFAAYLADARTIPDAMTARYQRAAEQLVPEPNDAVASFAMRHSWSLGCLDAAAAWLAPKSILRRKLLVAMAVLEASPEFAESFLPDRDPGIYVYTSICIYGVKAALKTAVGVPLLLLARYL